jgi:chromosome segregation ATPase
LDAYLEAKTQQRETERELQEMDHRLAALDNQVEKYTSRANNHLQWLGLKKEMRDLEAEILPRLRYAELKDSIAGARNQLQGQRRQWREHLRQGEVSRLALTGLESAFTQAREQETVADAEYAESLAAFQHTREQETKTEALLAERDKLRALCQSESGTDTVRLAEEVGEARQELARIELEMRTVREKRAECAALVAALKSGSAPPPGFVTQVRAALDEVNIAHHLLPEIVEVADTGWQAALEAVLAPHRHLVLLRRESDRAQAWEIGERLRYRSFISADHARIPVPIPGSLLEIVRFNTDPPEWLAHLLNRIQRVENARVGTDLPTAQDWITRDGYQRERRGGRHAGVSPADYHFGAAARQARLQAIQSEEQQHRQRLEALENQQENMRRQITQGDVILKGINAAQMLQARAGEFASAEERLANLVVERKAAGERLAIAETAKSSATEARHIADKSLSKEQQTRLRLEKEATDLYIGLRGPREEQAKRIQSLRHERVKLPPAWRERAALEALKQAHPGGADNVHYRIKELDRRLAGEEWETDASVLTLRDKLRADRDAMQAETEKRRADNQRAQTLTSAARGEYINVLRATVRRYLKNIRTLGELAGVVVHGELPHLENDDISLASAGLEIGFDFDSKGIMGMNDGEASGGQQVMKSLILLIGLMMDEDQPGGFVFIDEPFAHLDIVNIDRVGGFLKATRAQYLITSPITHNVNVYDPAQLTLVTHKKRLGESWAPPVAVISRQT